MGGDGVMHAGTIAANNFSSHYSFCLVWGKVTISLAKSRALSGHCILDSSRRHPRLGHQGDDRGAGDLLARLPRLNKRWRVCTSSRFVSLQVFPEVSLPGEQSYRHFVPILYS